MERQLHAIASYAIAILLLLLLMLLGGAHRITAGALLALLLGAQLLLLTNDEPWDGTHILSFSALVLTAGFLLIALVTEPVGVTYLLGVTLILTNLALIILETVAKSHGYAWLDRLMERTGRQSERTDDEDEQLVTPVMSKRASAPYVAKRGSTTYHRNGCRRLTNTLATDLLPLSATEAQAFGMEPCKACRP